MSNKLFKLLSHYISIFWQQRLVFVSGLWFVYLRHLKYSALILLHETLKPYNTKPSFAYFWGLC